ncbi:gluconate:H+ symporter [Prolixibacter denitrificans]|uniref:Gnt-I system high-affinity gluconate transporter n=1 Tax=Prolixibacter denitrificans TaxID=1541063 RepID=A0A2P8C733_9BACT|nr:gluconate:H+ symporter [Prolixibacter denitrificans]PSK80737.1 Gnt-I system high-affinity gluconate transporter [Prolixibacter denitrificans]GET22464.1 idonate transporter [Prolixibacter denitrificans]
MMPLLIVLAGVILLLLLITAFKLNAFISFTLVCLFVGLAMGLPLNAIIDALKKGMGETLGLLVLILGFGAMLGKLVADSGAAQRITQTLVGAFGLKRIHWALMLTGFIVGIPMFYSVGFVILIPIAFTIAEATGLPLLLVGLPMLASLSVTHGYLPPHPAPTAIAAMFHADIGDTMMLGLLIAIPAIIIAGPILSPRFKKIKAKPLADFTGHEVLDEKDLPSTFISILTALMPVILIAFSGIANHFIPKESAIYPYIEGIGNPVLAMLLSVLFAIWSLGIRRGKRIPDIMDRLAHAVSSIAMILLILAGAGGLKEVLVASGISEYLGELLRHSQMSPLFLAWLIAAVIRVSVGSATVAGMTAAGIVLPLASLPHVSPELMVLAIGSGSLMLSHVNDGGFWMFKEYFNLSVKETFMTWTVMETTISLVGLAGVFIINHFI